MQHPLCRARQLTTCRPGLNTCTQTTCTAAPCPTVLQHPLIRRETQRPRQSAAPAKNGDAVANSPLDVATLMCIHIYMSSANEGSRARFSLRTLLLIVTGCQVFLAACIWNLPVGVAIGLGFVGLMFLLVGARSGKRRLLVAGLLFLAASIVGALAPGLTVACWAGRQTLTVYVNVVDASSLTPVPGATIEILHGPPSPVEGLPPNVTRDFEVVPPNTSPVPRTDARGQTSFPCEFFAAGQDGLFQHSGYVDTRRVWLRVTAPGYHVTYMPLDRQSARARDIEDKSPLFVTVPVGKAGGIVKSQP